MREVACEAAQNHCVLEDSTWGRKGEQFFCPHTFCLSSAKVCSSGPCPPSTLPEVRGGSVASMNLIGISVVFVKSGPLGWRGRKGEAISAITNSFLGLLCVARKLGKLLMPKMGWAELIWGGPKPGQMHSTTVYRQNHTDQTRALLN